MPLLSHHTENAASPADSATSRPALESHGLYRFGLAYGRLIYRIRWIVIAVWLIGLAVSIPFAGRIASVLSGGGYSFQNSESVRVGNIMTKMLHVPPSELLVVFQSPTTAATDPAYQREVNDFISQAQTFQHVTSVTRGGVGEDGRTALVVVSFDKDTGYVEQHLSDFRKLVPSGANAGPARVYLTGNPAVYDTFTQITQRDTEHAEAAALPIALVVLLIVFGTLLAALMPLILAIVAVPVALAVIYAIAVHSTTSVFVLNVASIVGLGISIDYSLFMVRRFRDELARGRSVQDAIGWTVATAGEAILFSGLTVMIGFIGLLLIGIQFMTSFGIGGAVVVASAVLAALTLLPALLSVLGPRINAWRLPLLGHLTVSTARDEDGALDQEPRGFWQLWAWGVMRRPVLIVVLAAAILVGLSWPLFSLNIGTPTGSSLPAGTEARQGLDILSKQFPRTNDNPIYIVAQSPDGSSMLTQDNLSRLDNLTRWLDAQPHITSVSSLMQLPPTPGAPATQPAGYAQLVTLYTTGAYQATPLRQYVSGTTNGDTTLITVTSDTKLDSNEGKALIDSLRATNADAAEGLKLQVGGFQATSLDFNRYLYGNFPRAILFILVSTFFLLLLMFRSLLLPLKAILMNVLSVGAAYGVLVFIFQWGHFESFLGFTSEGVIDSTIPILMFCILFGLSMDYEVFLLSRIREEWLRTHDNRYAVARGLEKTGGVITNAALLFVIVTGAFTFTSIVITKEMGLGMTAAVLVDATIIRSLLVPATMRLLGRWNWWFPSIRRSTA